MAHTVTARSLIESDYDKYLVKWWKDWEWEPVPRDFLPENGIGGVIIEVDDKPVCAGFMYTTNSSVAWVDWIISSKDETPKGVRQVAIKMLITQLTEGAKLSGAKYIYALIKHKGLADKYKDLGFIEGDSYNSEMIKVL